MATMSNTIGTMVDGTRLGMITSDTIGGTRLGINTSDLNGTILERKRYYSRGNKVRYEHKGRHERYYDWWNEVGYE